MNAERLIREVERRLLGLSESARAEVLDAMREEIGRERRRSESDPAGTLEAERTRRVEAETLREILEAINRQARVVDTIQEVLKQLARIVVYDSCSLALLEPDGQFRILATRGFPDPEKVVGLTFKDALSDEIRNNRSPVSLADVSNDERFAKIAGTDRIRSWAGIPLLVEGDFIGLLSLDRRRVEPFDDEDLHRAKAVAFSAAAAIRKARLLEQVRRYAALMERTVAVDQAVFTNRSPAEVARIILEGAAHIGGYPGGIFVLAGNPLKVLAVVGDAFANGAVVGKPAPAELDMRQTQRMAAAAVAAIGRSLGVSLPEVGLYVVPVATSDTHVGTLAFLDPNGESADDRLMEAYASRAATAYLHALSHG
jgi:transcriptional regulator with GAF, ATPase, and Fis domain